MAKDLIGALADLREEEALAIVQERLDAGDDPNAILDDVRQAVAIVGQRFADSEYFVPDLVYSGEIMKAIAELLKPKLVEAGPVERLGKVIVGTVTGDIHDIGKDIVVFMLDANGFEVFDLGIDVPVDTFVSTVKETGCTVVALSGFLTLSYQSMKDTVDAFQAAGVRDEVKVMIGGGQIDEHVRAFTGADAFGTNAMEAVSLAQGWLAVHTY